MRVCVAQTQIAVNSRRTRILEVNILEMTKPQSTRVIRGYMNYAEGTAGTQDLPPSQWNPVVRGQVTREVGEIGSQVSLLSRKLLLISINYC